MNRQPHRVIVEGMDGSGKSTMIEELARQYPQLEVITRPSQVSFNEWWPREMDRSILRPIPIYDRFFYSELIYGPILRGTINANLELVNNVAWFMRATALLIYVRPHSDAIREGVYRSPQMTGVIDHFQELLGAYDQLMLVEKAWYGDRFYHYDRAADGAEQAVLSAVGSYLSSGT